MKSYEVIDHLNKTFFDDDEPISGADFIEEYSRLMGLWDQKKDLPTETISGYVRCKLVTSRKEADEEDIEALRLETRDLSIFHIEVTLWSSVPLSIATKESIVLDSFHNSVAIACLDDYDISVSYLDEHQG